MVLKGEDYFNGTALLEYIRNSSFEGVSGLVEFDANGDRTTGYVNFTNLNQQYKIDFCGFRLFEFKKKMKIWFENLKILNSSFAISLI